MTEEVRWTPAGRAALAAPGGDLFRDATDAALRTRVFAAARAQAAAWKRGAAKADDEGRAAASVAAATLAAGKLPARPSIDDAARLLSLVGASGSEHVGPLGELVIRARGLPFAIAVAARMWSHRSASDNPDWPRSTRRAAVYIRAIDDDDDHVHDASCSYSKAAFTRYLERRYRTGTAAERAAMRKGVTAIWKTTTPHARPALAYATRDPQRAKQSARELIHAGESPWPYFAWDHLPYVLTDAELVARLLRDRPLSVELIANLGTAAWPLYEARIGSRMDSRSRAGVLAELANFYGPRTALPIAEYEDTAECAPVVRDYFTRYPELLARVIDEPALRYHREDLLKLVAAPAAAGTTRSGAGTPRRARRRS